MVPLSLQMATKPRHSTQIKPRTARIISMESGVSIKKLMEVKRMPDAPTRCPIACTVDTGGSWEGRFSLGSTSITRSRRTSYTRC